MKRTLNDTSVNKNVNEAIDVKTAIGNIRKMSQKIMDDEQYKDSIQKLYREIKLNAGEPMNAREIFSMYKENRPEMMKDILVFAQNKFVNAGFEKPEAIMEVNHALSNPKRFFKKMFVQQTQLQSSVESRLHGKKRNETEKSHIIVAENGKSAVYRNRKSVKI